MATTRLLCQLLVIPEPQALKTKLSCHNWNFLTDRLVSVKTVYFAFAVLVLKAEKQSSSVALSPVWFVCFQQRGRRVICTDVYFIKMHHIWVTGNIRSVRLDDRSIGRYPTDIGFISIYGRGLNDLRIPDSLCLFPACFLLTHSLYIANLYHMRGKNGTGLLEPCNVKAAITEIRSL